jgi:hypothetical protein
MKPFPETAVNSVRRKFMNPLIKSMNGGGRLVAFGGESGRKIRRFFEVFTAVFEEYSVSRKLFSSRRKFIVFSVDVRNR